MTKYTSQQFAELLGIEYETLKQRLYRDSKKDIAKRKYPSAVKFGRDWMIDDEDLKVIDDKSKYEVKNERD